MTNEEIKEIKEGFNRFLERFRDERKPEKLLTVKEAAAIARTSDLTIKRWIGKGIIKKLDAPGSRILIPESEMRMYMKGGI